MKSLPDLSLVEKILFSGFIFLVGLGLLCAEAYTYISIAGLNGKPGVQIQDLVIHYYGNRSASKLQTMLPSMMVMAHVPLDERGKMESVINRWVKGGESKSYYQQQVRSLINGNCLKCHAIGMPNIGTFTLLKSQAHVDMGMPYSAMLMNGMIHLSTLGVIYFVAGWIFVRTRTPVWLKILMVGLPFLAFFLDFAGWFLTKQNPDFVWLVLVGGILSCPVALLGMALSLLQMWFLKPMEKDNQAAPGELVQNG